MKGGYPLRRTRIGPVMLPCRSRRFFMFGKFVVINHSVLFSGSMPLSSG